jgi:hypothetical protein
MDGRPSDGQSEIGGARPTTGGIKRGNGAGLTVVRRFVLGITPWQGPPHRCAAPGLTGMGGPTASKDVSKGHTHGAAKSAPTLAGLAAYPLALGPSPDPGCRVDAPHIPSWRGLNSRKPEMSVLSLTRHVQTHSYTLRS